MINSHPVKKEKETCSFMTLKKAVICVALITFITLIIASVSIDKLNALQVKTGNNAFFTKKSKIQIGDGFKLVGSDNQYIEYDQDLNGEISSLGLGRYNDDYARVNLGLFRKDPNDPDILKIYFIENSNGKQKRNSVVNQVPFSIAWHNRDISTGKVGINVDNPQYELHVNGQVLIEGNLTVNGNVNSANQNSQRYEQTYVPPQIGAKVKKEKMQLTINDALLKVKQYGHKEYDTNNTFDLEGGNFVVSESGFYHISLYVTWFHKKEDLNTYRIIQIVKNDTQVEIAESHTILAYEYNEYFMSCNIISKLQVKDTISSYILSSDLVEASVQLTIHKI